MGGRSSKSNKPDHVNYMEDIEQSCYEDKTILHEGPIHSICSVNENLMLSGGADKVMKFPRKFLTIIMSAAYKIVSYTLLYCM